MKNIFYIASIFASFLIISCEKQNLQEALIIQKPAEKTDEYYENLRAYKRSDHQIAFGWFGGWSAQGTSMASSLQGLPDSVDMVSIWGGWKNTTPEKQLDMKYVQKVKGTKVLICIIVASVGSGLGMPAEHWGEIVTPPANNPKRKEYVDHPAAIRKYAKAIVDTIMKYNYDGFDIDYEPNYGARGNIATNKDNMAIFVSELGKYLGPKSGTGKILCIDGEPDYLRSDMGVYFDYYISQAYQTTIPSSLQGRCNNMLHLEGYSTKKHIFAENFEKYWEDGGVTYTDEKGKQMPSLLGIARWNPIQGRKGGVGTYHMEYDFFNNPDYKYLREAIQIMNPAVH